MLPVVSSAEEANPLVSLRVHSDTGSPLRTALHDRARRTVRFASAVVAPTLLLCLVVVALLRCGGLTQICPPLFENSRLARGPERLGAGSDLDADSFVNRSELALGYSARWSDEDATMDRMMLFCTHGVSAPVATSSFSASASNGTVTPVMLTKHFAAWDTTDPATGVGVNLTALYLDTCFPIEISTRQADRSVGHCSDFAQYVMHAGARLSPTFPAAVVEEKLRRCPDSVYLHGEFPVVEMFGGQSLGAAPAARNYWMPNIEQISKNQAPLINGTHTFLAKTRIAERALSEYLRRHGMEGRGGVDGKGPRVRFMYHSSPDPTSRWRRQPGTRPAQDFGRFFHAYGQSGRKHRRELIECWLRRPRWPRLEVVGHMSAQQMALDHADTLWDLDGERMGDRNGSLAMARTAVLDGRLGLPDNIRVHSTMPADEFLRLSASHGVHLCPSQQEGYGHYINAARALGALVLTTDYPPMNEFVEDGVSGILVRRTADGGSRAGVGNGNGNAGAMARADDAPEPYQLLQDVFVSPRGLTADEVCEGVERVLRLPRRRRAALGQAARRAYDDDARRMRASLDALLVEAVRGAVLGSRARPRGSGGDDAVAARAEAAAELAWAREHVDGLERTLERAAR
ncbi:hypothetical protein HK405_004729, partial [Cladochytrium tenue]